MDVAPLTGKFPRISSLSLAIAGVYLFANEAHAQRLGVSTAQMESAFVIDAPPTQAAATSCKRSNVDVLGQLATGVIGAWVGGLGAYLAVDAIDPSETKVDGDAGYKPNANTAWALGSWAGSTTLIFLAGRRAGRRACGSFSRTALGTGIPSVVLLLGRDEGYLPLLGVLFGAPLQAIGGTLTFPKR
jgi:hypothetical protein